jgi:hypothetical protein
MEKEIEEAVKRLQPDKDCLRKTVRASDLIILIQLAQQYLAVKMPEVKDVRAKCYDEYDAREKAEAEGFNQALHLCKLAYIKSVPSKLEFIDLLYKETGSLMSQAGREDLASALRTLLLGMVEQDKVDWLKICHNLNKHQPHCKFPLKDCSCIAQQNKEIK